MEPTSSSRNPNLLKVRHYGYDIRTLSGYGSAASSLPGSGAVTPRVPDIVDPEVGERTALLDEGHDNLREAEAGTSTTKGEPALLVSVSVGRTCSDLGFVGDACRRKLRNITVWRGCREPLKSSLLPTARSSWSNLKIVQRSSGLPSGCNLRA